MIFLSSGEEQCLEVQPWQHVRDGECVHVLVEDGVSRWGCAERIARQLVLLRAGPVGLSLRNADVFAPKLPGGAHCDPCDELRVLSEASHWNDENKRPLRALVVDAGRSGPSPVMLHALSRQVPDGRLFVLSALCVFRNRNSPSSVLEVGSSPARVVLRRAPPVRPRGRPWELPPPSHEELRSYYACVVQLAETCNAPVPMRRRALAWALATCAVDGSDSPRERGSRVLRSMAALDTAGPDLDELASPSFHGLCERLNATAVERCLGARATSDVVDLLHDWLRRTTKAAAAPPLLRRALLVLPSGSLLRTARTLASDARLEVLAWGSQKKAAQVLRSWAAPHPCAGACLQYLSRLRQGSDAARRLYALQAVHEELRALLWSVRLVLIDSRTLADNGDVFRQSTPSAVFLPWPETSWEGRWPGADIHYVCRMGTVEGALLMRCVGSQGTVVPEA